MCNPGFRSALRGKGWMQADMRARYRRLCGSTCHAFGNPSGRAMSESVITIPRTGSGELPSLGQSGTRPGGARPTAPPRSWPGSAEAAPSTQVELAAAVAEVTPAELGATAAVLLGRTAGGGARSRARAAPPPPAPSPSRGCSTASPATASSGTTADKPSCSRRARQAMLMLAGLDSGGAGFEGAATFPTWRST